MVIAGLVALLIVITIVATIFSLLGLADKDQAMALPEGSIRAVIALALLLLFAILTVFLYGSLQSPPSGSLTFQSRAEALAFVGAHMALPNLKMEQAKGTGPAATPPTADKATDAANLKNSAPGAGSASAELYTVSWGANASADDFAKQLLTLLGTLVTSVVSFYFGAKTATSSAAATADQTAKTSNAAQAAMGAKPAMTLASITTPSYSGAPDTLTILGNNLNAVVHARIERSGAAVQIDSVKSNATQVTGQITVDAAMKGRAAWDVVVDDGGGNSARLAGVLTLT